MSFGRRVCYDCSRGFRYGRRGVDEVRTTAIVRGMGNYAVATDRQGIAGFSAFVGTMVSCALLASRGAATVLKPVTDPLTWKALRRAESLVRLDGDFKVEQAVYLKDSFEV